MGRDLSIADRLDKEIAAPGKNPWPNRSQVRYTIFVLVVTLTMAQLDLAIIPYLASSIKSDLNLSDWMVGLLLGGSFGLFYAFIGIPSAWFADRFVRKWVLLVGVITWSFGTFLCGAAQNFMQLFLARFVVGGGEALNGPAAYSIVADLVPRERLQRAIATYQLGAVLGQGLALLIGAFLLHKILGLPPIHIPFGIIRGWQLILMLLAVPGIFLALLIGFTLHEPARRLEASQMLSSMAHRPRTFREAVWSDFGDAISYLNRKRDVFLPIFLSIGIGGLAGGNMHWLPIFYLRMFGWEPAYLATLQGFSAIVLMPLGMFAGVWLNERFIARGLYDSSFRVAVVAGCFGVPAAALLPLMPTGNLAFTVGCIGLFITGMSGSSQAAAMQTVTPNKMRGKMTALYLLTFYLSSATFGPLITGGMTDFVFGDEQQIKWAMFTVSVIFGPISLAVKIIGLKYYRREVERLRMNELLVSNAPAR